MATAGTIKISLARRVEVFFTRHPEEELSTSDIAHKFDVPIEGVSWSLEQSLKNGMLDRKSTGSGRGQHSVFTAGPTLLEMIGVAMEACAPVVGIMPAAARK